MTLFWLLLVFGATCSILESDDKKLEQWHSHTEKNAQIARGAAVFSLGIAIWQLIVLWSPR